VTGAVDVGGSRLLFGLDAESFSPQVGDTFVILDNDGTDAVRGLFKDFFTGNDLHEGDTLTAGGLPFQISYRGGTGNDVALTRLDVPAMITGVAITPLVNEGAVATLTGRLVDPDRGDRLTLTVDWGDGSPPETFHPGREPFRLTHRYRDDDPSGTPADVYTVRFAWSDSHGKGGSDSRDVTVRNVAPTVHLGGPAVLRAGDVLDRVVSFADPGTDRWTATVDYGDGSGPQPVSVTPSRRLHLHHRYAAPGAYIVTVTVRDDDGGSGTGTLVVLALSAGGTVRS